MATSGLSLSAGGCGDLESRCEGSASCRKSNLGDSGNSSTPIFCGGSVDRRFRAADLILILFLLTALNPAFGGKKAPKLAETVDLPSSFDLDFKLAATQRVNLNAQSGEVHDDAAGQVGAEVFQRLVGTQMISGAGLPYAWTFRLYNNPAINAGSLPDGEVEAYTGIARLLGTDRGLWAAVLAHEIAHVERRHGIRKYLFHQYVEEQVQYWQLRARLGDKGAGWTALGVRIAGNLAEKKLSRDLEHDADMQGMLLMARAGYHPDYVFAMHHLLRMSSPERSKVGTFFFSDHPRWESRDQRTERAYTEALAEYTRLWENPETSPGGVPPAIAFLTDVRGSENKEGESGDLSLALSCRNVGSPVALAIHLTKGDGAPVKSMLSEYQDSAGNVVIHEYAQCLDADSARRTVVHIPATIIPAQDRKLRAQIEVLSPRDKILERSKIFDVHFPKTDRKGTTIIAKVRVEPPIREMPGADETDRYKVAGATPSVPIQTPQDRNATGALEAIRTDQGRVEVAAVTVAGPTKNSGTYVGVAPVMVPPELTQREYLSNTPTDPIGVLPSALDATGRPSNWKNSLTRGSAAAWWRVSPSPGPSLSLSHVVISFPVQPVDTESVPASVTIFNKTPAALTISGITLSGNAASDFTQTNNCGRIIDAGATCTVLLIFRPTANGTRTSILTVDGAAQQIRVEGIGK
jgi:Peptidase family M48